MVLGLVVFGWIGAVMGTSRDQAGGNVEAGAGGHDVQASACPPLAGLLTSAAVAPALGVVLT